MHAAQPSPPMTATKSRRNHNGSPHRSTINGVTLILWPCPKLQSTSIIQRLSSSMYEPPARDTSSMLSLSPRRDEAGFPKTLSQALGQLIPSRCYALPSCRGVIQGKGIRHGRYWATAFAPESTCTASSPRVGHSWPSSRLAALFLRVDYGLLRSLLFSVHPIHTPLPVYSSSLVQALCCVYNARHLLLGKTIHGANQILFIFLRYPFASTTQFFHL